MADVWILSPVISRSLKSCSKIEVATLMLGTLAPGEDSAIPVQELARRLLNLLESEAAWHSSCQTSPHESQLLRLDISKARQGLGWEPLWSIDATLEKVAEWHRGWRSKVDIESLCIGQIDAYQNQVASRAEMPKRNGWGLDKLVRTADQIRQEISQLSG